jgi:hypothetical protein
MTYRTGILLVQLKLVPLDVVAVVMVTRSVPSVYVPELTGSSILNELVAFAATLAHVGFPGIREPVAASATDGDAPVPIWAGMNAVTRFNIRNAASET